MKYIKNKKPYMIYPDDDYKNNWDLLISGVLIFTCLVTPVRMAFVETDTTNWKIVNYIIDSIFLLDIIFTFNQAFYDEDFKIISDRKEVACNYIRTWFLIDLFAIVPFEFLTTSDVEYNEMARLTRLGRMYKLVKLTRLIRILKIIKNRSQLFKYAHEFLKISIGFERLFYFILGFFMVCHIVGCLWILMPQLYSEDTETWLTSYSIMDQFDLYLTSIYFTVTTITTVGYGDISGNQTNLEKIFCIFIMAIGVIAFSFASGSLASIIQNYDTQNAKLAEQLNILNRVYKDYFLPLDLYTRLKQSLKYNFSQDIDDLNDFLKDLPHNLKIELSLYIHEETYKHIYFMKDKTMSLIAWICPLLKTYLVTENEYVYFEGDEIVNVQFMKKGSCGFVLPKFNNAKYINI